jgi:hypothetical protein
MVNSKGVRLGKTALFDKEMQEEGELRWGYVLWSPGASDEKWIMMGSSLALKK